MTASTKLMPIFPLEVFICQGRRFIRIFEPRYQELINDLGNTGESFGIPFLFNEKIMAYGSEVELASIVARNSLGQMVVVVKGIRNFHILQYSETLAGKPYGSGSIEYIDDDFHSTNPELIVLVKKLKLDVSEALGVLIKDEAISLASIARALMMTSTDKYTFYSLRSKTKMENFLIKRLRFIEQIQQQERLLANNFSLN
jgi:Lon protease-like protein